MFGTQRRYSTCKGRIQHHIEKCVEYLARVQCCSKSWWTRGPVRSPLTSCLKHYIDNGLIGLVYTTIQVWNVLLLEHGIFMLHPVVQTFYAYRLDQTLVLTLTIVRNQKILSMLSSLITRLVERPSVSGQLVGTVLLPLLVGCAFKSNRITCFHQTRNAFCVAQYCLVP